MNIENVMYLLVGVLLASLIAYLFDRSRLRRLKACDLQIRKLKRDPTTGLSTRAALGERLQELLASKSRRHSDPQSPQSTSFVLLFLDLDRFKYINDTFGHISGDRALRIIADRLQSIFRSGGVFRYGGDEFVVILRNTDLNRLPETRIQQLYEHITEPFTLSDELVSVGLSIGLCEGPGGYRNAYEVLRAGDIAMYRSKQTVAKAAFAYRGKPNNDVVQFLVLNRLESL
jgi:diguanylate cyclase (GGDEF)-like protein